TGGNDTIRLVRDASVSGQLNVFINNVTSTPTYSATLAQMSQLAITDSAGNDTFVLDFTNGTPLPSGPITLTASTLGTNLLQVVGASTADSFGLTANSLTYGTDPAVTFSHIQTLSLATGTYIANADLNGLNLTANAGATITLNATTHLGTAILNTGGKLQLPISGSLGLIVDGLTINGGILDLANNSLLVHNGVQSTLTTYLHSGYNGGAWNGASGILSSYAALPAHISQGFGMLQGLLYNLLNPTQPVAGVTPADTDVVVKYTYLGDASLNGSISADDFAQLDASFLKNQTNPRWVQGDFNYDNLIDASDYAVINAAYASQATHPLAAATPALSAPLAAAITPTVTAAVTTAATPTVTPAATTSGAPAVTSLAVAPAVTIAPAYPLHSFRLPLTNFLAPLLAQEPVAAATPTSESARLTIRAKPLRKPSWVITTSVGNL
ncbi:MAG: hypothetical protein WCI73_19225, partial [Phycisphaerae bacterium]